MSISQGIKQHKPNLKIALKFGLIFGITEAVTPIIGWSIGKLAASYVEAWDHWLVLLILSTMGIHMIYESFQSDDESEETPSKQALLITFVTAIGTSIDAMAIGAGLAFIQVNILVAALLIGLATFTMVTIGVLLGHKFGQLIGKRAEIFGGVILILVGLWIFINHTLPF